MLARKNKTQKKATPLPQEWIEALNRLLNETYSKECKQNGRYFDVFGQAYPDELVLAVSYLSEKDEYISPITCILSSETEQIDSEEKLKGTQKNFIDLVGLFFDEIFADSEWNEFEPNWQEVSHKGETYFYKITRENINLTLEADRLLGEDFLDEDT